MTKQATKHDKARQQKLKKLERLFLGSLLLSLVALGGLAFNLEQFEYRLYSGTSLDRIPDASEDYARQKPYECTSDELFDIDLSLCYYSCPTQNECKKIEKSLEEQAQTALPATIEQDEHNLVTYSITPSDDIILDRTFVVPEELNNLQGDTDKHQRIWDRLSQILPQRHRAQITQFTLVTDGANGTLAGVQSLDQSQTAWEISIDIADAFNDKNELQLQNMAHAIIHEFGHILTLDDSQIDTDVLAGSCPQHKIPAGCLKSDSHLLAFMNRFWTPDLLQVAVETSSDAAVPALYEKHPDRFVTEYAATNPEEDWAETWTRFVLQPDQSGSNFISEQKVKSLHESSVLLELRGSIREQL